MANAAQHRRRARRRAAKRSDKRCCWAFWLPCLAVLVFLLAQLLLPEAEAVLDSSGSTMGSMLGSTSGSGSESPCSPDWHSNRDAVWWWESVELALSKYALQFDFDHLLVWKFLRGRSRDACGDLDDWHWGVVLTGQALATLTAGFFITRFGVIPCLLDEDDCARHHLDLKDASASGPSSRAGPKFFEARFEETGPMGLQFVQPPCDGPVLNALVVTQVDGAAAAIDGLHLGCEPDAATPPPKTMRPQSSCQHRTEAAP